MSKSKISFNVELRERVGTGGSRAARREGLVPGVLYGGGEDPVAISLKRNEVLKAIETGHFLSSTATLVHKGEKQMVIPQAIQMHPVSDQPMHVDLFRVSRDQKIKVEVQVHFIGEEVSPGLKKGGTLNVVRHTVELLVPAGNIPESLEADVSELEVGDNVKISDIKLPGDAEPTITDRDFTIATIAGRTATTETTTEEGEEAEGEEPAAEADAESED
ncbi:MULTISPECIES: 50S ribosomal protein L25/general stress protein Ctc [unclassified Hyphomonas]|jgi:large subunit ribosomal protein L25|uniref:50S ribosomal protein L25/general stress protein Ctc n=2 Tax=Hyphomonas TaxID=85 RepID=UPI000C462022|nr:MULTISPECIES: 50S ribosomal protein L25/general stress protein Ctc [unclassified Hyphomonas]MAN90124.1 50S ribosomal protein L25/general stress protein Ctc [Hyphomonadaceae bacterium]MAA80941.1 50S ribosomal protein L25/general stress protein Ctc [Hyphomonas sp.]MBO6582596.1 50S ribosomal protein L25/general stress protein Ctc [Hyphomonas sp.]QSR21950.1 50S ribosomal protein L25/general stress protein Ctc [Hyphomonas sp. KY3]RCL89822.1 MAG: 50S ribosomal protein L25/general stress protein C|tara:strand:- start:3711 stop:4364 length:654 start_codon:yes stop_codon:yes gene_type:complete